MVPVVGSDDLVVHCKVRNIYKLLSSEAVDLQITIWVSSWLHGVPVFVLFQADLPTDKGNHTIMISNIKGVNCT